MLWTLIKTIWLFLPAYTPNNFAVLSGGGRPIDMGKNFVDGRRILGDGKTFRGFAGGVFGGVLTGIIQYLSEPLLGLSYFTTLTFSSALLLFLLLSTGSLAGDMLGSFIKRRLGIGRGEKAPILDQLDFLIISIVFASFHRDFSSLYTPEVLLLAIVVTPILHKLVNVIAYLLRLKDVPW